MPKTWLKKPWVAALTGEKYEMKQVNVQLHVTMIRRGSEAES